MKNFKVFSFVLILVSTIGVSLKFNPLRAREVTVTDIKKPDITTDPQAGIPVLKIPDIEAKISRDSADQIQIDLESVEYPCNILKGFSKNLGYILSDSSRLVVTDYPDFETTGQYTNDESKTVYQCHTQHPNPLGADAEAFVDSNIEFSYYSGCTDSSCLQSVTGPVTVFGAVVTGNAINSTASSGRSGCSLSANPSEEFELREKVEGLVDKLLQHFHLK